MIKKFISFMYNTFLENFRVVSTIFDNDAHNIVSKRGWEKLNEIEENH